jgi:uncharacterized glyoxalase superfamily protein PhnB
MKFGCVTLDSGNAEEHAEFYQKLLGWTIRFTNTVNDMKFIVIMNETKDMALCFQEDDDYKKPVWPTEQGQQQQMAHLDFFTDDLEKDVNHAIACGAKLAETQYSDKWRVMIDPAGHPFCIEKL